MPGVALTARELLLPCCSVGERDIVMVIDEAVKILWKIFEILKFYSKILGRQRCFWFPIDDQRFGRVLSPGYTSDNNRLDFNHII